MLEKIELENFVSHRETLLKFDRGVTIFIGRNGSGKSSVIDAITFALYGQHTRGQNRNLVRRGSEGSKVALTFTMDSKRYQATRTLDARGSLTLAKLEEITEAGPRILGYGERRTMGEAMSVEAGNLIGLDYEKLRVAAVVQQGELDAILENKPREFKELINALIGIERLDRAFESMGRLITLFRERLRKMTGYDDQDIETVKQKIFDARKDLEESQAELDKMKSRLLGLSEQTSKIKQRLNVLEHLSLKSQELEEQESDLLEYVRRKSVEMKETLSNELLELEDRLGTATANLEQASLISEVETKLEPTRKKIEKLEESVEKSESALGRLNGLLECAEYLKPVDGKCPVCGAEVKGSKTKLKYDPEHIRDDLSTIEKDLQKKKTSLSELKNDENKLLELQSLAKAAIKSLRDAGMRGSEDVARIREEIRKKNKEIGSMPEMVVDAHDPEKLVIDDYSHALVNRIGRLRKEVASFDRKEYDEKQSMHDELVSKEKMLERDIGRFTAINERARMDIDTLSKALEELKSAYAYVRLLEGIREGVFNRDGSVAMSLRSWALRIISQKGSEYISMFGVNVSRLELTEKRRDVEITCYGPRGAIDMSSLSGGEKVAIALALRLAMAYVMGHGSVDFVILDEPTTHLDEERRQRLVSIITEAFREGLGPLSQIIIITHDADIFENANVDSVYMFSIGPEGTVVTAQ